MHKFNLNEPCILRIIQESPTKVVELHVTIDSISSRYDGINYGVEWKTDHGTYHLGSILEKNLYKIYEIQENEKAVGRSDK